MGGKTSAKATNAYNARAYDRLAIMVAKGEGEAIKAAAKAAGESANAYMAEAVRQRMAEDSPAGATVCKIRTEAVEPWAKAAGQSVREYVAAAVKERIAADKEKADKSGKKP